jgi:hypothetical protein
MDAMSVAGTDVEVVGGSIGSTFGLGLAEL